MLAQTLTHMFPGIQIGPGDFGDECVLAGTEILRWYRPEPQPTPAEIEAAYPLTLAAAQRAAIPSVSIRQMHTALHRVGLLAQIKAYIAASGDIELEIAFQSPTFERPNALIGAMARAMGKTDAEVDAIFALAASI